MQFNLSTCGSTDYALLVLENEVGLVDSLLLFEGLNAVNIPEGNYNLQISVDDVLEEGIYPCVPILEQLNVDSDYFAEVNLVFDGLNYTTHILPLPLYFENELYSENVNICIDVGTPSSDLTPPSVYFFKMAYELEWEHDSLLIYYSDENIPDYIYTGHNPNYNTYYIKNDYVDKDLRFCLVTDESFGYKGVDIPGVMGIVGNENSSFTLSNKIILPNKMSISQNYPNPFNPTTEFNFSISKPSNISLNIYNLKGELVYKIIDDKYYNAGGIYSIMISSLQQFLAEKA